MPDLLPLSNVPLVTRAKLAVFGSAALLFGGIITQPRMMAQPTILPTVAPAPERFMGRGNFVFSTGLRFVSGLDIDLGGTSQEVGFRVNSPPLEGGSVARIYDDGTIGNPGDAGNVTRFWSYRDASQVPGNDTINYHLYSAAGGGEAVASSSSDGLALDLQVGRLFFPHPSAIAVGFVAGASVAGLEKEGSIAIDAPLTTITDTYSLNGVTPPEPETSTANLDPIGSVILNRTSVTTPTGADVTSNWRLNGGYFNFRLGPVVYLRFNRVLAVHLGGGFSAIYASTKFEYSDTFTPPFGDQRFTSGSDTAEEWLMGYYAEASVQVWLSNRSGLFLGASMQRNDDYTQRADTHTARIGFKDTTSFMFGVNFRF